jgi:cation transport regulator ChaC
VEPHEPALTHVWGVLYTIPDADLATLDRGEGQGYHRVRMPVRITDADIAEAWVYLASRPSNDAALRPYTWYTRFLVEGAQEHAGSSCCFRLGPPSTRLLDLGATLGAIETRS